MFQFHRFLRTSVLFALALLLGISCSEEKKTSKYPISSNGTHAAHAAPDEDAGAMLLLRRDFRKFVVSWAKDMNARFKPSKEPEYVIDAEITDAHVKHVKQAAYGRLRASLRLTYNGIHHPKYLYRHLLDSLKDVRTIHLTHLNESRRQIVYTANRTFYGIFDGKRWALYRTLKELRPLGVSGFVLNALADSAGMK